MTENHPITPPLKLFREWTEYRGAECEDQFWWRIATQAANWGFKQCIELDSAELEVKLQKARDEELEACCEYIRSYRNFFLAEDLREVRRPKPPSLKERIATAIAHGDNSIALALLDEALPD